MDVIVSSENTLIKTVIKLKQRKYRYEYGKFVLEGYRLIKDSVKNDVDVIVIVSESKYKEYAYEFANVVTVSDRLFDKISDTVNSQGIIAVVPLPEFKDKPHSRLCLYLDGIRDPGNLGAIVRTAAACGFCDIVLCDCVDVFNPKAIRSSMSAFRHCNFILATDDKSQLDGYTLVCADANGKSIAEIGSNAVDGRLCLIIGNEANGISDSMKRRADVTVALPMENGVESLNAAVGASVIMYYLRYLKSY
jgi:TrmH family RNA methyltransferase